MRIICDAQFFFSSVLLFSSTHSTILSSFLPPSSFFSFLTGWIAYTQENHWICSHIVPIHTTENELIRVLLIFLLLFFLWGRRRQFLADKQKSVSIYIYQNIEHFRYQRILWRNKILGPFHSWVFFVFPFTPFVFISFLVSLFCLRFIDFGHGILLSSYTLCFFNFIHKVHCFSYV